MGVLSTGDECGGEALAVRVAAWPGHNAGDVQRGCGHDQFVTCQVYQRRGRGQTGPGLPRPP